MKKLIFILTFLTNLTFGQTVKLTETAIEKYAKSIEHLKEGNNLVKILNPNMSRCGGGQDGYYLNKKLVLIEATYSAELGFSSRTLYYNQDKLLKIIYREHLAEWGKYDQNYPSEQYEFDPLKMTYSDTVYSIFLCKKPVFKNKLGQKLVSNIPYLALLENIEECGQEMAIELQDVINQVDSLKYVKEMPYMCEDFYNIKKRSSFTMGCGDELYWNAVRLKDNTIELLIDKLDDTTTTEAIVPLFGYFHTTADIAYTALQEIIHNIPTFVLLGVEFDKEGCGYCSYWQHLNKSYKNREVFKSAVKNWYHANKEHLIWIENNSFETCLCYGEHPNSGHYELKIDKK